MSEKLERKEESGREWAQVGGRVPTPLPAPPTAGALDRNNKETSTNLHGPAILTVSRGPWTLSHPHYPGMDCVRLLLS